MATVKKLVTKKAAPAPKAKAKVIIGKAALATLSKLGGGKPAAPVKLVKAASKAPKAPDYASMPVQQLAALPSFKAGSTIKALTASKDHGLAAGELVTIRNVGKAGGKELLFFTTKTGRKSQAPLSLFIKRGTAAPVTAKGGKAAAAPAAPEKVEPRWFGDAPPKGWKRPTVKEVVGKKVRLFRFDGTDGTQADINNLNAMLGSAGTAQYLEPAKPDEHKNTVFVKFPGGRLQMCLLDEIALVK
jgi:hypothetical protein